MKSVLVDFLVGAGIKVYNILRKRNYITFCANRVELMGVFVIVMIQPTSIVSYNHLGNNDGMNLSAPQTFRSKEISKSNVVDDMVSSNGILYEPGEHPDHVVVIKVINLTFVIPLPSVLIFSSYSCNANLLFCSFLCACHVYSMCHMLEIARELWMSTPQRYSWVAKTPLWCTTPVKTPSWLHQSSWIWFFLQSLAPGSSSKVKQRCVFLNWTFNPVWFCWAN